MDYRIAFNVHNLVRLFLSRKWTLVICSLCLFWRLSSSFGLQPCPNSRWKLEQNTTCLLYFNEPKSWPEARKHCWNHGANLPIFSDGAMSNVPFYKTANLTGQWTGLYVRDGKLWWDHDPPVPAKPEEFGYKWSQKPSNLADDSHAVVSYFAVNHSIEFFYINLKIVPGLEKRSFTCFRGEQSYRSLEDDDPKCWPQWKSGKEIDYCTTEFSIAKDFKKAQTHCQSLNSSLWTPTKEYDFDYMRNFMTQREVSEMHMDKPSRILDLPSWNWTDSSSCHYVDRTSLLPGNCSTKRRYLCRQPAEESASDVRLKLKRIPKEAVQLSIDTYLINSTYFDSIVLECVSRSTNQIWIKDGDYRTVSRSSTYETFETNENSLANIVPRADFSYVFAQGTYACASKLYEHGWKTSNTLAFQLNDVLVTWLYVKTEFERDIDLGPFAFSDADKNNLRGILLTEDYVFGILINYGETYIYPEAIIGCKKMFIKTRSNTITLKFGLYTRIFNTAISKMYPMTKKQIPYLNYLISYLRTVEDKLETFFTIKAQSINEFLNGFGSLNIPSKRKRSPEQNDTPAGTKIMKFSSLYVKDTLICHPDSVQSAKGSFRFEAGLPGEKANSTSVCPNWDLTPLALGLCNGSLKDGYSWEVVQTYDCLPKPSVKSEVTDKLLEILNSMKSAIDEEVIIKVEEISANMHVKFTYVDVRIVAEIVQSASRSLINLDREKGQRLANIVSNTMLAPLDNASDSISYKENIAKSKFRLTKSLESVIDNVGFHGSQVTWPTEQFTVRINQGTNESCSFGLVATGNNESDVYVDGEDVIKRNDIDAGIIVPNSAYKAKDRQRDKIRTSFIIYKRSTLFDNPDCQDDDGNSMTVSSFMISGAIQDFPIANLSEGIKLRFKIDKNTKSPTCAFISEDDDGVNWHWSREGVTLEHFDTTTGILECSSNHLTNFAVFAGFCKDPNTLIAKVLTHISIIGMVLSIICLSLVILCQMFFKKFRKGQIQIALLNLSIALIVVNLLVLLGVDRTSNHIGCIIVAALLHYFLLVSFAWMLIEAILQYYKFVKVFNVHVSRFVIKTVLPAWILPALIVGITAAIDYHLFRGPKYYCWLAKKAFYYAFLLPLGFVVVANTFIFIRIIKGISCDRPKDMQTNQTKSRLVWLQVQVGICCFVVMGLTWGFALFAFGRAALVMQFLFAFFNSLQGFFIFILFNLREKPVRKAWYDLLCRKKTGKKAISSDASAGFLPKNRNKYVKDDVVFTSSDACLFKNTNATDATLSD